MGGEDICGAVSEREVRIFGGGDIWEAVLAVDDGISGRRYWVGNFRAGGEDIWE